MFHLRAENKSLIFSVETSPDIAQFIKADENKLKEILINLIGNAIKFTPSGSIHVHCQTVTNNPGDDPENLRLIIDVQDTGIGIQPEDIQNLFQPFAQTISGAQIIGGTGLGLAISQSHARLMGGEISVSSVPGQGSCFHVEINVRQAEASEVPAILAHRPVKSLKAEAKELRVLVVDDLEDNRLVVRDMLEPLGFLTQSAENGERAVALAKSWRPNLILMDLRMPVMDGFEASRQIKRADFGSEMIIIALTASILDLDRNKLADAGLTGYLRKPFKDYELFEMLEEKLGEIFIYQQPLAEDERPSEKLSRETLLQIPEDMRKAMRSAAVGAHFDDLLELINSSSVYAPNITENLQTLVLNYQYETLYNLLAD